MIEKTERRGRPVEQVFVQPEKFTREYYEVPTKPELGTKTVLYYDTTKNPLNPYKSEITYPKGYKHNNLKAEKHKSYNKQPVVLVFKTSNRSNAQTKMKIFANENIDYIMSADKLVGVPETAIILELAVGGKFIDSFKSKYSLQYL